MTDCEVVGTEGLPLYLWKLQLYIIISQRNSDTILDPEVIE